MKPFERYKVQWRGYIIDGTENENGVINEQNVLEFRFRNKSLGYNVYVNGILLQPNDEFYERLQDNEKTFGDYEIRWESQPEEGSYKRLVVMVKTWVVNA